MFIYKMKVQVKEEREKEWYHWMCVKHIRDMLNTEHFIDFNFLKLNSNKEAAGKGYVSYEIEYFCFSEKEYNEYKNENAESLQREHDTRYKEDARASRETYLDVAITMLEEAKREI